MLARLFTGVALSMLALLTTTPAASAEPREVCGPHTPEDQVVRVFARGADESALLCGSRYYGFRRIDWRAVSRSNTWIHTGEVIVVVAAGDGQVITARPVVD